MKFYKAAILSVFGAIVSMYALSVLKHHLTAITLISEATVFISILKATR